jgi:hypothetical protein
MERLTPQDWSKIGIGDLLLFRTRGFSYHKPILVLVVEIATAGMAGEMMFLKVQRIPDNGMVDSYSIPREQLCEMFYKPNTN